MQLSSTFPIPPGPSWPQTVRQPAQQASHRSPQWLSSPLQPGIAPSSPCILMCTMCFQLSRKLQQAHISNMASMDTLAGRLKRTRKNELWTARIRSYVIRKTKSYPVNSCGSNLYSSRWLSLPSISGGSMMLLE